MVKYLTSGVVVNTDVIMDMPDSPSEVEGDMIADGTPLGYLPSNESSPTPFTAKQVQNNSQAVMTAYKSYPTAKNL